MAGDLATLRDHLLGQVGDREHVLVGLGGQAAHEVELHLPPAVGVRRRDRADQVLLGDHLVDHLAHPLRPALGGEGQPRATAVARELVGQGDVEGVDAGARQRQRDVGALVAVGQPLGDLADLGVVGAGERQQPDLLEAGLADAVLDHVADRRDRPLPDRAGDHPGLAEAAATGAAPEDLDAEPLVHGLGQRHQRVARVGPGVEVHQGVLAHPVGYAGPVGRHGDQGTVRRRTTRRRSGARRRHRWRPAATAARRDHPGEPSPFHSRTTSLIASTISSPSPSTTASTKSAIGSGLNAAWPPASTIGSSSVAVLGVQWDTGKVERVQHVGVAQLGGKRDAEDVEVSYRTVAVHRELRDAVLAHHRLHVGPHRVGPFCEQTLALVEDLVEDLHTLVRQAHLVRVGVHQHPTDVGLVPRLLDGVEFAADVLDGLAHSPQMRLERGEDRLTS